MSMGRIKYNDDDQRTVHPRALVFKEMSKGRHAVSSGWMYAGTESQWIQ